MMILKNKVPFLLAIVCLVLLAWPVKIPGISIPFVLLVCLGSYWQKFNYENSGCPLNVPSEFPFYEENSGCISVNVNCSSSSKARFLFDTGSPYMTLSKSNQVHRIPVLLSHVSLQSLEFLGKSNQQGQLIAQLELGSLVFSLPWVIDYEPSPLCSKEQLRGIIGTSLFARSTVVINRRTKTISILRSERLKSEGWVDFESPPYYFPIVGPSICIKGKLEQQPVEFLLDTGFVSSMIPPNIVSRLGVQALKPSGAISDLYPANEVAALTIRTLELGNVAIKNFPIYAVIPNPRSISRVRHRQIILGTSFFRLMDEIRIDFANKKILLIPTPNPENR